jgi:3-methyladenine DNA glycosylase/8-oxoguanine DNA glycosylase
MGVNEVPTTKRVAIRRAGKSSERVPDATDSVRIARTFDPDQAIEHLKKRDRHLKKLIEKVGPFNLRPDLELSSFDHLFKAIVYQQLTGKAAATIHARTKALLNLKKPLPPQLIALPKESLRSAGLSGSKAGYLKDLAEKALAGEVPSNLEMEGMTDEEIIERLTAIKGIGRWSVEMLLIFHLGRPDVLPVGDYGVRKGFAYLYGHEELPTAKELSLYAEIWRPYRSIGSWYMWRAAESMKAKSSVVPGKVKTQKAKKPLTKPSLKVQPSKSGGPKSARRTTATAKKAK